MLRRVSFGAVAAAIAGVLLLSGCGGGGDGGGTTPDEGTFRGSGGSGNDRLKIAFRADGNPDGELAGFQYGAKCDRGENLTEGSYVRNGTAIPNASEEKAAEVNEDELADRVLLEDGQFEFSRPGLYFSGVVLDPAIEIKGEFPESDRAEGSWTFGDCSGSWTASIGDDDLKIPDAEVKNTTEPEETSKPEEKGSGSKPETGPGLYGISEAAAQDFLDAVHAKTTVPPGVSDQELLNLGRLSCEVDPSIQSQLNLDEWKVVAGEEAIRYICEF